MPHRPSPLRSDPPSALAVRLAVLRVALHQWHASPGGGRQDMAGIPSLYGRAEPTES